MLYISSVMQGCHLRQSVTSSPDRLPSARFPARVGETFYALYDERTEIYARLS